MLLPESVVAFAGDEFGFHELINPLRQHGGLHCAARDLSHWRLAVEQKGATSSSSAGAIARGSRDEGNNR
ncbi:hypothetical protein D3C76_1800110 [compost metagenome]